jgi:phosphoserine/homoserine phosphotransferase
MIMRQTAARVNRRRRYNRAVKILCLDFESVLAPEIWPKIADLAAADALRQTTRDVPDLNALMQKRIAALRESGVSFSQIAALIQSLEPLPGAADFLHWARQRFQVAIVSDSFYQFVSPLLAQLSWPMFIGHDLEIDDNDAVAGWRRRHSKPAAVNGFQQMGFAVAAVGDSFNDIGMLRAADYAVLFAPSPTVKSAHPEFTAAADYAGLCGALDEIRRK